MEFKLNPAFEAELKRRIAAGVEAAGKDYLGAVITAHEGAARGGTGLNKFGQPRSAPGEIPAMETGRLRAAMSLNRAAYNVMVVQLNEDDYPGVNAQAAALEEGTVTMRARPLWTPTLLEKAPDMARAFVQGFRR